MPTAFPPGSRNDNRTWVVRGTVAGKRCEVRTTVSDPKRTRYNEAAALREWDQFADRLRAELAAQRRADEPPNRETATVAHAIVLYREAAKPDDRMSRALDAVLADPIAGARLADVTPQDVRDAALRIKPASAKSANRWVLTPLSAALALAHDKGLGPALRIRKLRETAPRVTVSYPEWTAELAGRALDAGHAELHALLMTFAVHGWRVGECLMIRHEWIDYRRGTIRRWVAKSREWIVSDVEPGILDLWRALPMQASGRLWSIGEARTEADRHHAVYPLVDALLRPGEPRWRPHQARRGFATAADEEGRTLAQIQAANTWKSRESAARYIRVGAGAARGTVDAVAKRARKR